MENTLTYQANNSGGYWWLKDADWKALEDEGWLVGWLVVTLRDLSEHGGARDFKSVEALRFYESLDRPEVGKPRWEGVKASENEAVIAVATTYAEALAIREQYGDYIGGALSVAAAKQGTDPNALVAEWERITGQNAGDEGCNCCGKPHDFTWYDAQGESHYGGIKVTSEFCGF